MDFLSLKSRGGLKVSRRKTPCCICHTCWLSYFTLECLWCGRACVRSRDYLCTVNQNSYPWCTAARARALPKMFVVNQDVKKRQNRPLSRGSHFVSGDLKNFVYAQLALWNLNLLLGHEDFQRFQGNFLPDLNLSARKILKLYSDNSLSKSYGITAFNLKH